MSKKFREYLELNESQPNWLEDFKKDAIKMWVPKYKREYTGTITSSEDVIYLDEGVGKVKLVSFEKDGLRISGSLDEKFIKYVNDEFKFIMLIQKAGRDCGEKVLMNLKGLNDNILLRDFERFSKYNPFFTKANKIKMQCKSDITCIMKKININPINIKDLKTGDTIYLYDFESISLGTAIKIPVQKIKIKDILFRDDNEVKVNDEYIVNLYNPVFRTEKEAQIYFLWMMFGNASYVMDTSRIKTKNDKVTYIKNMIQYEKFLKKFPNQMEELNKHL